MDLSSPLFHATFHATRNGQLQHLPHTAGSAAPTASERVLAAELQARGEANDALSMMVGSIARMVQAGKSSDSRWKSS